VTSLLNDCALVSPWSMTLDYWNILHWVAYLNVNKCKKIHIQICNKIGWKEDSTK